MDLTIADARLRGRRMEPCRAREVVCDFFTMPLYFGELPIIFWLLIAGARERVRNSVA